MARAMASRPNRLLFPSNDCYDEGLFCPPPPPCPPPSQEPPTTISFRHRRSSLLPALPIAAASFLAVAAALALLFTLFILRRRRRRRAAAASAVPDEDPGPFEDGGGGVEVDHHAWYIRTTGLDESTIGAITAWAYKADDGVLGASAADCAVCLSEFRDGEIVRLLPKCGHAFHLNCIDTWLRSHVNCPLCRAPVVAPTSAASGADPGTSSSSFSSALSSPDFALDHLDTNSFSSALVDSNQIDGRQPETGRGALEVETETEGENMELGAGIQIMIDQIPNSELRVPIDIGEHEFQPIRRSFSVGSLTRAPSMHRSELEEGLRDSTKEPSLEEDWDDRTWRKQGNASSGTTSLQKETERSSSSASGRFFLSRHGRARSSVLPL